MTTDSRKIQLETGVDATGAKAGFQQVKDAAKDMATSVAQSGNEAAKGVDGIGAGADASARAYGRFEAEIRRKSASIKASLEGTGAAGEIANKAMAQGLDASRLEASLQGLRELERQAKATAAAARSIASAPTLTTSLGATSFVKPLGNPSTSLGATGFGATAEESQKAAAIATQSLGKIGVSAAQTANALRGVPAQFTDIVTSLQGGQAPLTVFLQQGGQLKDMFGGIGPAAKALGGYVLGLINPLTVAAAAVGTLGVAFYQGAKESENFNKAIILTGNYLGTTVSQLQVYSKEIAKTVGTQGAAAEALSALANSGKVAKTSLTEVGTAVVYMNRVLGQSVDEATATFVKLADEPTKASQKLNESMHYLNLATYERIRALEEQGNKEAAAALAQKAFADETTSRLQKVEAGAGSLERGWRSLADGAKSAWDAMLGIGRTKSIGDALGEAQTKLNEARAQVAKGGAYASLYGPSVSKGEADVAALSRSALNAQEKAIAEGEKAKTAAAQIGASDRIRIAAKEAQTNADMREKFKKQTLADYKLLGDAAFKTSSDGKTPEQVIADYNEKHKDPKGEAAKEYRDDAATKMLEGLRQQEAALKEQLSTDEKLTASEKERAKFVQLVADLKTKGTLTIEQKSLLLAQDSIKAQLDKNVAIEDEVKAREKARKEAERIEQLDKQFAERSRQRTEAIASSRDTQNDQYDRVRATFGLGARARQEVEAQRGIFREYNKLQLDLIKNTPEHLLGSDKYKEEAAKIKEGLNAALDAQKQFFADEKAAREDWSTGAKSALADYVDYVNDAASRARSLLSNSLNGFSDSVTEAIFGDKGASFKKLGENIAKQITKGIVEQQLTKPIAQWLEGAVSDKDSMFSKIFGGLTSNKETGENWLGMLGLGGGGGKAGGATARGSTMGNPLYVQAVGGSFGGAANDSSSGGGGILGMLGGLFGGGSSNSAATAAANAMPGDALDNLINLQGGWGTMLGFANGGDPPVGRISMVGENGPEMFIPRQAGTIIPNDVLRQRGGGGNVINISVDGQVDRRTRTQIANETSLALRRGGRMG